MKAPVQPHPQHFQGIFQLFGSSQVRDALNVRQEDRRGEGEARHEEEAVEVGKERIYTDIYYILLWERVIL